MLREDGPAERDGACSRGITEAQVTGVGTNAVSRRRRTCAQGAHDNTNFYGRQNRDDQNADGAQSKTFEQGGAEEKTALRGQPSSRTSRDTGRQNVYLRRGLGNTQREGWISHAVEQE